MGLEAVNLPRPLFIEGMGTGRRAEAWSSQKMHVSKQLKLTSKERLPISQRGKGVGEGKNM